MNNEQRTTKHRETEFIMNDTEKLNWLLTEAGHTRGDLDKAIELDELLDGIVEDIKSDRSDHPSFKEMFDWLLSYHNSIIATTKFEPLSSDCIASKILSDNDQG